MYGVDPVASGKKVTFYNHRRRARKGVGNLYEIA